eukprot:CAMPEP_0194487236 /NCGR_PEP_ID=MMETSP0253-20130528/7597_1 /TAXON_ID=2966 /ORGANISM="Noctiluca scintillans" /LENGTH=156 /DNA_ID=CAMNT_0039327431 /DNA_START=22 /DNA_END=492 /DNA_ORIENTATION=-
MAPGVDFNVIAREWRCKWSSDFDMYSLLACQSLLDDLKDEMLGIVHGWNKDMSRSHQCFNGAIDTSRSGIQRIIDGENKDFKVVIKLPADIYSQWAADGHPPEQRFLEGLHQIHGVSQVETQTYTLETVNLWADGGKIKVPSAKNGCMADKLPKLE